MNAPICSGCLFVVLCSTTFAGMPLWEKVAFSSDIVVGSLKQNGSSPAGRSVELESRALITPLLVTQSLKGTVPPAKMIDFKVFAFLSDESLRLFSGGKRATFFLQKDQFPSGRVQYSLVNPPDDGITPSGPESARKVNEEMAAQTTLLSNYGHWSSNLRSALPVSMATLGDRLLDLKSRERAVADILDLPDLDVWMLILVMDDRRNFDNNEVYFSKRGLHGYDASSLRRPEQVIDLIGEALDYKTGKVHVNLSSCLTDEKRQFAVKAWRIYLYHNFIAPTKPPP